MKIHEVATAAKILAGELEAACADADDAEALGESMPAPGEIIAALGVLADHVLATAPGDASPMLPIEPHELMTLAQQAKRYLVLRELVAQINGAVSFERDAAGRLAHLILAGFDTEAALKHNDQQCDAEIERIEKTAGG